MREADELGADLQRADLRGRDLRGADLRGRSLVLADLQGARLEGADLRDADLRGANLADCDLRGVLREGARFEGALLLGARSDEPHLSDFRPRGDDAAEAWRAVVGRLAGVLDDPAGVDADEALEAVDEAALRLPEWRFVWVWLARHLDRAGRDDLALDVAITAVGLDPRGPARAVLARLLLDRGDYESARLAYERLREDYPEDPQLLAELGYALGRLGETDEARACLQAAVAGGVRGPNTLSALGMVAWEQGDAAAAGEAFAEAAEASGGAPTHVLTLSRYLEAVGDLTAARDVLQGILDGPDAGTVRLRAATLASGLGDLEAAVAGFEEALRLAPGSTEARLGLADARLRQGRPDEALTALAGVDTAAAAPLRARIEARRQGLPAPIEVAPLPPPPAPPAVALPLTQEELNRLRTSEPTASPYVDHVFFASPQAIGHVLQAGPDSVVAFRGEQPDLVPLRLQGRLQPAPARVARDFLLEVATGEPAAADEAVAALFDGRSVAEELQHLSAGLWPGLRRRMPHLCACLADRYGLDPALPVTGDRAVLDPLVPDTVLLLDGRATLCVPPSAHRRGDPRWQVAQALAWYGVDQEVFFRRGALVPHPEAPVARLLADRQDRPAIVGLSYVAWLRWFLGLARLWPDRRERFGYRALAVVEEIDEARLLALAT